MIPTIGNVTITLWDLGGQRRFRTMWEIYRRGVTSILYVVDAADRDNIPITITELHDLLMLPVLDCFDTTEFNIENLQLVEVEKKKIKIKQSVFPKFRSKDKRCRCQSKFNKWSDL